MRGVILGDLVILELNRSFTYLAACIYEQVLAIAICQRTLRMGRAELIP